MNPERLLMMFLRPLIRRLVNRGVDAGIDRVAGKGKSRDEMTPEERQQATSHAHHPPDALNALSV
ncbi:MAG: hypothetical protein P8X43_08290 [Maritimibacter sp.]